MATKPLVSDYLVPAGVYIREALEHFGMTQMELAERTGRPSQAISEIVNAKKAITEETAFELESVLGTPAHVWLNLEGIYRYGVEASQRAQRISEQIDLADSYPYNELVKLGYLAATRDKQERVSNLLSFFGIAHLALVQANYAAAFQNVQEKEVSPYCLAAWLRIGERMAEKIDLSPYNKFALRRTIPELRRASSSAEDIDQLIPGLLGSAGVAFVVAPHLSRTFSHGATFWHGNRPILLMSNRVGSATDFWFTLFHKIGHILLHERSATFIEGFGNQGHEENEADQFARDTLISL